MATEEPAPSGGGESAAEPKPLLRRLAGSTLSLATKQAGVTALSGLGTAAVTRLLGPASYGQYAAAIALWSLLGGAADFGFSLMLARDLGNEPRRQRLMLRTACRVGLAWSSVLALVQLGFAFSAHLTSDRGLALIILAPAMISNGFNAARVIFLVHFRTRALAAIDFGTTFIQVLLMVLVASLGLGPVAVTAVVSLTATINSILPVLYATRSMPPDTGEAFSIGELIRGSAPLGLLSIMTRVYVSIDVVILGWMITGPKLGDYAAATKILALLAAVVGLMMLGLLPSFSSYSGSNVEMSAFIAKVWHWMAAAALPIFIGLAIFAPGVIKITVGSQYHASVGYLRILSIAGALSVASNFLGTIMIAKKKTRALFIQNGCAITLNVIGNVLLIPSIGPTASAWMTAGTELLVCVGAVITLSGELSFEACLQVSLRPIAACVLAAGVGIALRPWPVPDIMATSCALLVAMTALRAWPEEFIAPTRKLLRRA